MCTRTQLLLDSYSVRERSGNVCCLSPRSRRAVVRASISVRRRLANEIEIEIEIGESALSWWVEGYPRSRSTN